MKLTPIQNSFHAGELSPLWYGRSDTERYHQGLAECRNFICDSRGPFFSRPGGRHIFKAAGNIGRSFIFRTASNTAFGLIFTHQISYIIGIGGQIPDTDLISNPLFLNNGENWEEYSSGGSLVIYQDNLCTMFPSNNNYAGTGIGFAVTNFNQPHRLQIVNPDPSGLYEVNIGTVIGDGSIARYKTREVVHEREFTFPHAATFFVTIIQYENDLDADKDFAQLSRVSMIDTSTASGLSFPTLYQEKDLHDLHGIDAPGGNDYYLIHPKYPPYKFNYNESNDTWTFGPVSFTGAPTEWVAGNYPATGVFYQGRLWLGGTPNQPETFWGSKSGLPEDFTIGTTDADGLKFTMEKYGRIEWMESTKNLLIGTVNGEHIVTSQGGVITPGDIQVSQQSAYGSASVKPILIGDQVMYTSPDRRRIYGMQYEWQANNWLSVDLTFPSEHITNGKINDFSWAQNPYNILWMVLRDGDLVGMTYERSNNIIGWHRHDTQGLYVDISSSVDNLGESFNLLIVNRKANEIQVEMQLSNSPIMDAYIEKYNETAFTTVEGLEHLEGMTVKVLVGDGAVHPDRVVSGGQITLQELVNHAIVGLGYTCRAKTMPFDKGGVSGSGRIYKKSWNNIWLQMYGSARPMINGKRPPVRRPVTPMGLVEPLETSLVKVSNLGVDEDAPIEIVQDLPLYTRITGLFGEVSQDLPL